jgi:hypothetical protein
MSDDVKRDIYGVPSDPADRYYEFLLGLHDIAVEASDAEYSVEALAMLRNAREMFMDEFGGYKSREGKTEPRTLEISPAAGSLSRFH